jgi:hypothetical protein
LIGNNRSGGPAFQSSYPSGDFFVNPDYNERFGPEAWNDPSVPKVDRLQRFVGIVVGLFAAILWLGTFLGFWGIFTDPDPKKPAIVVGVCGSIASFLTTLAWSLWQGRGVPLWVMRLFAILGFPALILVATQARGIWDLWMLVGPGLMLYQALPVLWKGPVRVSPLDPLKRIDP